VQADRPPSSPRRLVFHDVVDSRFTSCRVSRLRPHYRTLTLALPLVPLLAALPTQDRCYGPKDMVPRASVMIVEELQFHGRPVSCPRHAAAASHE
jgi:hypothetical protein